MISDIFSLQQQKIYRMNFFSKIIQKTSNLSLPSLPSLPAMPSLPSLPSLSQKFPIIQITQQIYHSPFPTDPSLYTGFLKQHEPQAVRIWNLSQYPYDQGQREKFQKMGIGINQVTYQYYSSMPLTVSIVEIKRIQEFLWESSKNIVIVHCQENNSRSKVFLSIFLYFSNKYPDIATSLAQLSAVLPSPPSSSPSSSSSSNSQTILHSQHLSLRNIANYNKDPTLINPLHLRLRKIILSQAPTLNKQLVSIQLNSDQYLEILVEVRRGDQVLYKRVTKQFGQGEIVQVDFRTEAQEVVLYDDFLVRFKYVYKGKVYPVIRIQVNTNFVYNAFMRVQMQEIDISKHANVNSQVFADFLFQPIKGSQSQLSKIWDKKKYFQHEKPKNKDKSPKAKKQSSKSPPPVSPAQPQSQPGSSSNNRNILSTFLSTFKRNSKTQQNPSNPNSNPNNQLKKQQQPQKSSGKQKQAVTDQKKKQGQQTKEEKIKQKEKNIFNIDQYQDGDKGQITEDAINKMLDDMAMKKAQVNNRINEQDQDQDQAKDNPNVSNQNRIQTNQNKNKDKDQKVNEEDQKMKQIEYNTQYTQQNTKQPQSSIQNQKKSQNQQKPIETSKQNQPTSNQNQPDKQKQKQKKQKPAQKKQQSLELDIDDYLSKLEQEAEDN